MGQDGTESDQLSFFLPLQEGLIDIRPRHMAFRLEAAQKLLYNNNIAWSNSAVTLLRKTGNMGLDKNFYRIDFLL